MKFIAIMILVKQVTTDENGKVARLPIQIYFTNIMIAMNCMGRMPYKIDVVNYAVDNMDPDVKAEMELTYTGHLAARTRDPITQTRAIQAFLIAASAAERKVINTRNLISSKTTALLIATVPGYTAAVASTTPAHKSVAERTILNNTPLPPFEWEMGKCVACGSTSHRYKVKKEIVCPHADFPNAKEYAKENYAKMRSGKGRRNGDGPPAANKSWEKPKWEKMGEKAKCHFAQTLLANTQNSDDFNKYISEAQEKEEEEPVPKKTCNVTVLPSIAVLNGIAGAPPLLPVRLDGNLPHMDLEAGGSDEDNLKTLLRALIYSSAGATIGWLQYFEAVVLINPSILVQIFTCVGGKYSPITMHGIVDEKEGANTTELPVAFQIRTRHRCHDGSELHMIVGLGMNVSVNFIISNAWMKQIGAVIDYGASQIRVPLLNAITKFPNRLSPTH